MIFKSKTLFLNVKTVINGSKNWQVRRPESDFYMLRSILSLSYGQNLIPPLTPVSKEATFDSKSLRNREKYFERFLRSVLKSPSLSGHPCVLEFLKIDHYKVDPKLGVKEFSKKLSSIESELNKRISFFSSDQIFNGIYRVTAAADKVSLS